MSIKRVFFPAALLLVTVLSLLTGCKSTGKGGGEESVVLNEPFYPTTAEEMKSGCDEAIAEAELALEAIVKAEVNTFENTIVALDRVFYNAGKMIGPQFLLQNVSPDEALRKAADESVLKYREWSTKVFFREELYEAVNRVNESNPKLKGEDKKLLEDTMKGFTRNGFGLPEEKRAELEELKVELGKLSNEFNTNVREHDEVLTFTKEELAGVPETSLAVLKQDEKGNYLMDTRIWSHYAAIARFAKDENVRLKAHIGKRSIAKESNPPVLTEIIKKRARIAELLGYENYADYKIELKMAGDSETAMNFLQNLSKGVEQKFLEEQESLRELKARETGNPDVELKQWDGMYYERILFDERYSLDMEGMKRYFAMDNCLEGMFNIYQTIFGISIRQKEPPRGYVWHDEVLYYEVNDAKSGEILGGFYLDLYPREGKYSHFAHFGMVGGSLVAEGMRERPVSALVCNFPKPTEEQPSLLSFDELSTLFHEFGHAMHFMLSKTKYSSFHGTSVPGDFVEAPSQMLEQWLKDKQVLDTFAYDYEDPSKKIPQDFLDKMEQAEKATIGRGTRGQIAFGMIDLILHTQYKKDDDFDIVRVSNDLLKKYWMDYTDETAFIAGFGHLAGEGYAAGYYGYMWANAISYDLASLFKRSPKGFLDAKLGMKLRKEIYQPGGSRDVNESIKRFLGRDWNNKAFFEYLGIE